jgi:uncharacterized membrane protein
LRRVHRSYGFVVLALGIVAALSTAATGWLSQSSPGFAGLGDLPGDANISYSYAISDSGDVIAGESFSAISQFHGEGVRWERDATGWQMTGIGLPTADAFNSPAGGVSSNGVWTVGRASVPFPPNLVETYAYRWSSSAGFETLPFPSGFVVAAALDADKHGHLVVGYGGPNAGYTELRALAWPTVGPAGQVQMIEPSYDSQAVRIDPQGKLVAGWGNSTMSGPAGREAVYWTRGTGGSWARHWLGALPGVAFRSQAAALARHGSKYVIVGYSGDFADVTLPTLWRVKGDQVLEMDALPLLPGCTSGAAYGISDDRSRIVGNCWTPDFEFRACVWDLSTASETYAATDLQERLSDLGITAAEDWTLWSAADVNGDGTVICGSGTNPLGEEEAWVAELP